MSFQPGNTLGKRWQKGESGNPKGRSKLDFSLAEAARAHSPEMLQIAVAIARDQKIDAGHRLRAVEIVLSRGHGRPIATHLIDQRVEHASMTQVWVEALRELSEQRRGAETPPLLAAAE